MIPSWWRRSRPAALTVAILAAVSLFAATSITVLASTGDRSWQFKKCVADCVEAVCTLGHRLPLHLRLLLWDCPSDCDYRCQRALTMHAQRQTPPGQIHQYYGKWPFVRLLGIQEPASVVFSVLNGYAHYRNWAKIKTCLQHNNFIRPWLLLFVVVGTWTWAWSAIFHTRDFPFTEKMDYYSAGLSTLYLFFVGLVYLFEIRDGVTIRRLAVTLAIPYLLHVGYLQFVHFDYSYNMAANAGVSLLSAVVWAGSAYQSYKRGYSLWWKPLVLIGLTVAAFSLEAFDFPPLMDTFDAHSLWHLATIPIIDAWYDYLIRDASWKHHITQHTKD
ncbi:hypothetical protein EV182_005674 [Spiromyces aspiralis]|uniref:Uncharacterized protein n=1 Tax=Spiromyces aspiralis TaxID=68401 RepID=A0ACC1H9P3_9FUNG|nr:hypothetical protein EV182_005674 [Spiromyces aspiralis]